MDSDALVARWQIAEGYYLYRDKIEFTLKDAGGIALGPISLKQGKEKDDDD